jgi:chitin disaccharide deacetylase
VSIGAGLLIINGDDWGYDPSITEAIAECFRAGAITSVSAMVYMSDSARAASLAASGGEPVGLHVNLTEAFTDPDCPEHVRARQQRLVRYFAGPRWRMWGFSLRWFTQVDLCIADQLEAFRELYGREPTHIDGHEHVHQSLGVMFARSLPSGAHMRPSFTFLPGEKSLSNRLARRFVNRLMRVRFRTPRYLFDLREIHPALGGAGLERKLDLARGDTVEVMTHPGQPDEHAILLDDSWDSLLRGRRLGAYADLASSIGTAR